MTRGSFCATFIYQRKRGSKGPASEAIMDSLIRLSSAVAAVALGAVASYTLAKRVPFHQGGWLTAAEIFGPLIFWIWMVGGGYNTIMPGLRITLLLVSGVMVGVVDPWIRDVQSCCKGGGNCRRRISSGR